MANNHFLTGLPKSGKTTILRQLVRDLQKQGYRVGGFLSPEVSEHGTRKGFYVEDIASGKRATLAEAAGGGPRVGRYRVDVRSFESIAMPSMENAYRLDVIFIDEIGAMELESTKFADALADLLQTDTPVVASLSKQYLDTYEIYGSIYNVTESNRAQTYNELLETLVHTLKKKPTARLKFEEKEKVEKKTKPVPAKKEKKMGKKAQPKPAPKKEKTVVKKQTQKTPEPEKKEEGFFDKIKKWLEA